MEYGKIKQLIEDMGNSKLSKIEIEFSDGTKIKMKKEIECGAKIEQPIISIPVINENAKEEFNVVKSPMVGTFYAKPSPTSESYVEEGKRVKKGDVLCIIEAMKLMNEIESEFDGEIKEILVKDGEMVEYGKPLFKIG